MHLYLVRHAMALHNQISTTPLIPDPDPEIALCETLRGDTPLSAQGRIQAQLVGERLRDTSFDAILSSPLQRALATAQAIAQRQVSPPPIECLPDLMECGVHDYAGMPVSVLCRRFPGIRPCPDMQPTGVPSLFPAENKEALRARADRIRDYLLRRFSGDERVLLVSHGAFMGRHLLHALLEIPPKQAEKILPGFENASLSKLTLRQGDPTILALLDDINHLGKYRSRDLFDLDGRNIDNGVQPLAELA